MHHCPEVKQITLKDLAATAQVVDKYQCQHAFHAISRLWLEQHLRAIGAAASLPEYLGIALAFQQPDIERAVVLGIAITTGRLANSSTTKERIQSTMLADQVSQEYCSKSDAALRFYHLTISQSMLICIARRLARTGLPSFSILPRRSCVSVGRRRPLRTIAMRSYATRPVIVYPGQTAPTPYCTMSPVSTGSTRRFGSETAKGLSGTT